MVIDELDDLFALLAAQRRGQILFAEELEKPDDDVNLVRAAMYIAMHRRPTADVDDAEAEFEVLAAELEALLPPPEVGRCRLTLSNPR